MPSAYLTSTKNIAGIFAAIQRAAVPQAFTYEFLKNLGFASSADRPAIPVLKTLGFLSQSGSPTQVYREYRDATQAAGVMARALRHGYKELFEIDEDAHLKSSQELAGMFGRLSDKGEAVTAKMASTFRALVELADFGAAASGPVIAPEALTVAGSEGAEPRTAGRPERHSSSEGSSTFSLRHDIHIHLPLSTDVAVYDAIFKSLKANLL